jgi:hypothetical protein
LQFDDRRNHKLRADQNWPPGDSGMRKQILFLLLFPLVSWAQRTHIPLELAGNIFFVSEGMGAEEAAAHENGVGLPAATDKETPASTPPDAPGYRGGGPLVTAVYEPTQVKRPEPALRNDSALNKKFIVAHAVLLGSMVYDAELTHEGIAHHKCVEANPYLGIHPSRGEIYGQNLLAFGAITGLDWMTAKLIKVHYLPYVAPIAESVVHFRGGSQWLTECW